MDGSVTFARRLSARWRPEAAARWAVGNAPIVAFLIVYLFTCLLGALLLLFDYHPFVLLFEHFSGTRVPVLSSAQRAVVLILLCGAPLSLWFGYFLARRIPGRVLGAGRARDHLRAVQLDTPSWVPTVVFALSGVVAFSSVARAGALRSVSSWFDYGRFVVARETVFSHVSFLEFVNIYMFLPFAAAWLMLRYRRPGLLGIAARWLPLVFTELIDLLLFQKKTAVISLLIVGLAWLFFQVRSGLRTRRLTLGIIGAVLVGVVMFFATVVVPVYSKVSSTRVCVSSADRCGPSGQVPALVAYSVLSPLTRTSAPVLYYPLVFPRVHRFYGLDLFQDELGLPSAFPDDNRVIWQVQNPNGPAGTSAAPFQFSLFSGAGWVVTLIECAVIGGLMGLAWRLAVGDALPVLWSSLLASCECIFGVYLAIDSWRNDTTVSYGALWGVFFIVVAAGLVHLLSERARRLRSWQGALAFGALATAIAGVALRNYGGPAQYVRQAAQTASAPSTAAGLPRGWALSSAGVRVEPAARSVVLTTTAAPYGYQLESPTITLAPGRYVATLVGRVRQGGLDFGVVASRGEGWIRQETFRSRPRATGMRVPFSVSGRAAVRLVLANDSPAARSSNWVLSAIMVNGLSDTTIRLVWPAGTSPTA